MYVYLDECGCTGFKFRKGSSRFFTVALVIVKDRDRVADLVGDVREELGLSADYEFKSSKSGQKAKQAFYEKLRMASFTARCIVVDKANLVSPHLRSREPFYNYFVKLVLEHDGKQINDATLVLDESFKGKGPKRHLSTYLRRELNVGGNRKIKSVRYRNSGSDDLLQVADMVVGAVSRRFERSDDRYWRLIEPRVNDVWEFQ